MRAIAAAFSLASAPALAQTGAELAKDATELDRLIVENYAYVERWPAGVLPDSPTLKAERAAVHDKAGLLRYAEHRIATLADHHAITGPSFKDSWGLVPTYSDLWIEWVGGRYDVTAVRDGSPADKAGIRRGDRLIAVGGVPIATAVDRYWTDLGLAATADRRANAARVLATGRRDRQRQLTLSRNGTERVLNLPTLYAVAQESRLPLTVSRDHKGRTVLRINNALGDDSTIGAFDAAMNVLPRNADIVIDLRDTPSGGNTTIARAVMSWFARRTSPYQVHSLPSERRRTGIERRWIEQVVPRTGKHHLRRPTVLVGRWTGSMGEGLAIGLKALGARICGDRMAGLLGAIYDFKLPASGMTVKFPAERLETVAGQPRENFVPEYCT